MNQIVLRLRDESNSRKKTLHFCPLKRSQKRSDQMSNIIFSFKPCGYLKLVLSCRGGGKDSKASSNQWCFEKTKFRFFSKLSLAVNIVPLGAFESVFQYVKPHSEHNTSCIVIQFEYMLFNSLLHITCSPTTTNEEEEALTENPFCRVVTHRQRVHEIFRGY